MDTIFEVKLKQYSGPLEKLLELIEGRRLEIAQISLAAVTADYLSYIKELKGEIPPAALADFLVIASRLLLIKSKILIPDLQLAEEEEAEIADLEMRLKIFKEFKYVGQYISEFWDNRQRIYSREFLSGFLSGPNFYPPKNVDVNSFLAAANDLISVFQEFLKQSYAIKVKSISLEEKAKELLRRINKELKLNWENIGKNKARSEIIVLFLALLQLLKDGAIKAEQAVPFSDILIERP